MELNITGKDIDLGDALRTHVTDRLTDAVQKYFDRPSEGAVTISREGSGFRCDCTAHLSSGIVLNAQGAAGDAYAAFDDAAEKLEKRVRRYKRRLKNHHAAIRENSIPAEHMSDYVLAPTDEETDASPENEPDVPPVIVAETKTELYEMTVGTAVMRMDLADEQVLVFRNAAHGEINVVYRRPDGNIGWIDPKKA